MSTPQFGSLMGGVQFVAPTAEPGTRPAPVTGYAALDAAAIIAEFARRLQDVERSLVMAVPSDRIMSMIQIAPEAILIQSDRIGLLGGVTFADWQRDINGVATGEIDPSITQIRGGTIRTEKILSFDGDSWIDLDATGTTPFIKCDDGVQINADGTFTFGSASGKQLVWNGTTLTLGNSSLLGSTAVATVVAGAANGNTALTNLALKLNKSASDILSGDIQFTSGGGFKTGTISIDGSGNATGSGVAFTSKGIVGMSSSTPTFSIDATTGAATFSGQLSAASGTFAGDVVTSGRVIAQGQTTVSGVTASVIGQPSSSTTMGVMGMSNLVGVYGWATDDSSVGVVGRADDASSLGGQFLNNDSNLSVDLAGSTYSISANGIVQFMDVEALSIHVGGEVSADAYWGQVRTVTSNTTLNTVDSVVLVNAAGGNITITLPAANAYGSGKSGQMILRRIDAAGGNTVTVQRAGSDTIEGTTSITAGLAQGGTLVTDGVNKWFIV